MKKLLIFTTIVVFFSSCNQEKSEHIKSSSPDDLISVEIFGSRTVMEPWTTNIVIAGLGNQDTLTTEVYADELSAKTVNINWMEKDAADISITQTDGTKRTFHLLLNETTYTLSE